MASKHYRRDRTHVLGEPTEVTKVTVGRTAWAHPPFCKMHYFGQRDREHASPLAQRYKRQLARGRRKRSLW
jgi:hypothetical protein